MALKISDEVRQSVIKDRAEGMTLDAIVDKWKDEGVTKNWVRQNTKSNTKKDTKAALAISKILPLAIRPVGVKPSEYYPILKECYGVVWDEFEERNVLDMTPSQKSYVRTKVKEKAQKIGKEAYFIPEWMDLNNPVSCNKAMLGCAQNLYDAIEYQVQEFVNQFPDCAYADKSVRNELYSLVVPGYDLSGVISRCERNSDAVRFLTTNKN